MASAQTLPDTACSNSVGVGPTDIPHAYVAFPGSLVTPLNTCFDHFSGEYAFALDGAVLFSRTGSGTDPDGNAGGSGVEACYGNTDPTAVPTAHHGTATTIYTKDDVFGGSIGFSVIADWNRSATNPVLPSSNSNGDSDCGDGIIEPCNPADEATVPGCNHLDYSTDILPLGGICTGTDGLIGDPTGVRCTPAPGPNSWTAPGGQALADIAGADGAVIVLTWGAINTHLKCNGGSTTGAIWTA